MKYTLYLILILSLSQSCLAFDSERQGLVLTAGVGFAPTVSTEISGFGNSKVSSSDIAVSFSAGYGYNENTLFVMMIEGAKGQSLEIDSTSENIWQGFSGAGVRFYFDEIGSSFFISSGIGLQFYLNSENAEFSHDTGLGFLVGGGYEFAENFQIQTSIINGQTKDSFRWNHFQLNITISGILY